MLKTTSVSLNYAFKQILRFKTRSN